MEIEETVILGFLALLFVFGASAAVTSGSGSDFVEEQTVSHTSSHDVSVDVVENATTEEKVYGYWAVVSEEDGILDSGQKELMRDKEGNYQYERSFERTFTEAGNYSYYTAVVKSTQQINEDVVWEDPEFEVVDSNERDFEIHSGSLSMMMSMFSVV